MHAVCVPIDAAVCVPTDADAQCLCFLRMCVWLWQAWYKANSASRVAEEARRIGTKYKRKLEPVTVFQVITGGALQAIGEFDNMAKASAAAGILGQPQNTRRPNPKLGKNRSTAQPICQTRIEVDTNTESFNTKTEWPVFAW
jgi:hypothetical protein